MKRGTYAEQIAFKGAIEASKGTVIIPDTLPVNPLTGKRWAKWADWEEAHGISRDDESCISNETWTQSIAASRAIRQAMTQFASYRWQVHGKMLLDVPVPSGYNSGIEGTCDILTSDAIYDIKVIGNPGEEASGDEDECRVDEESIISRYIYQISSYALMHNVQKAGFIVVFPVDKAGLYWDYHIITLNGSVLLDKETIEGRCRDIYSAYQRMHQSIMENMDVSNPISQPNPF